MIILAIPIYYQDFAYLIYPDTPRYPTTTAEYIALPPSTDPSIAARNQTIAKDAVAWGWKVYNADIASPKMENWWAQYEAAAKQELWDSDIWRIWQREHGVRIAEERAKNAGGGNKGEAREESLSKRHVVIRGMKKLGRKIQSSRQAAELELRQLEARKRELREEARKNRKTANERHDDNSSEISLPGSFMGRLELWRNIAANKKEHNPFKLTQHPWLSQR